MTVTTENIWADFEGKLLGFITARVSNKEIAKDILQDVFIKIHLHLKKLKSDEKLSSWIYQITRNAIIDYYRKKKIESDEIPEIPESIDEGNLNQEFYGCLKSHINQLDEKDRDAIVKVSFEKISQKEYAVQNGLSYSAAKSRVQRARQKLNELFTDCCQIKTDKYGNIISSENENCNC
jgi:RNA polymerase sigma-70 factor (ECF subfamily)